MINYQSGDTQTLPLTVTPAAGDVKVGQFVAWIDQNRQEVLDLAEQHGALLFRGFGFCNAATFEEFARSFCPELRSYVGGNSPRHRVEGAVYTSTEYPPEARISLHNEASYLAGMPRWIMFYCDQPAKVGGQTPIADCRRVLTRLSEDVQTRFANGKVRYINNLHGGRGFGRSWQQAFESTDRSVVEERLQAGGYEYVWKSDGGLRTSIVSDAVVSHPVTGETVWINQAEQWHPSSLDPQTREMLGSLMDEEDFPHNATFGDGSPLPEADLDHIRQAMSAEERTFEWSAGDVLVCDNFRVSHGRQPYEGTRRVLVALS